MRFEITKLILSILTFIVFTIYSTLTYLIAKNIYIILVSFSLNQIEFSHIKFSMINKSRVEVEVFSKLWCKIENELFEFKEGFYGNKTNWILQPFTEGHGHFNLKNLKNKDEINLDDFVKKKEISSINFNIQIKYRKVGRKIWKKSSPQNFIYNFKENLFWLNV